MFHSVRNGVRDRRYIRLFWILRYFYGFGLILISNLCNILNARKEAPVQPQKSIHDLILGLLCLLRHVSQYGRRAQFHKASDLMVFGKQDILSFDPIDSSQLFIEGWSKTSIQLTISLEMRTGVYESQHKKAIY